MLLRARHSDGLGALGRGRGHLPGSPHGKAPAGGFLVAVGLLLCGAHLQTRGHGEAPPGKLLGEQLSPPRAGPRPPQASLRGRWRGRFPLCAHPSGSWAVVLAHGARLFRWQRSRRSQPPWLWAGWAPGHQLLGPEGPLRRGRAQRSLVLLSSGGWALARGPGAT